MKPLTVSAQGGGAIGGIAATEITVASEEKCPVLRKNRQFFCLAAGYDLCGGRAGKECGTQHNEPTVHPHFPVRCVLHDYWRAGTRRSIRSGWFNTTYK